MTKVSRRQPKVSVGIVVFIISLFALIFIAAPMQHWWGMWGLAFTEVMIFAIAIIAARGFGWTFKDVFPLKIPSLSQILAVLVLWLASFIAVYVTTVSLYYLFPAEMSEVSTRLKEFFTSVSMPMALFMVAVLPSVCEEFLQRGLIQYTFIGKPRWVTILSMAVIFGLFHLDVYRFLGTAILGGMLTYVMLETDNLLLPILLHFVNNVASTSAGFVAQSGDTLTLMSLTAVGSAFIVAAVIPFLFLLGRKLLLRGMSKKVKPIGKGGWLMATLVAVLLLAGGIGMLIRQL